MQPEGLNRPHPPLDTMKRGSLRLYEKLKQTAHKTGAATLNSHRKIDEPISTPKNLETKITDILGKYLISP